MASPSDQRFFQHVVVEVRVGSNAPFVDTLFDELLREAGGLHPDRAPMRRVAERKVVILTPISDIDPGAIVS